MSDVIKKMETFPLSDFPAEKKATWLKIFYYLVDYAERTKGFAESMAYRYHEDDEQNGLLQMCLDCSVFIADYFMLDADFSDHDGFLDKMKFAIEFCESDFHN